MLPESPGGETERLGVLLVGLDLAQDSQHWTLRRPEQEHENGDAPDADGRVVQGAVGDVGHGVDPLLAAVARLGGEAERQDRHLAHLLLRIARQQHQAAQRLLVIEAAERPRAPAPNAPLGVAHACVHRGDRVRATIRQLHGGWEEVAGVQPGDERFVAGGHARHPSWQRAASARARQTSSGARRATPESPVTGTDGAMLGHRQCPVNLRKLHRSRHPAR